MEHGAGRRAPSAAPTSRRGRRQAARSPDDWSRPELAANLRRWMDGAPKVFSSWEPLEHIYRRSLVDLAALRFRTPLLLQAMPAAGLPWFMAIFGRDSLLTSFQALPFAPGAGRDDAADAGDASGPRSDDPFRDEEPGKILHELRFGEMTAFEERPHSPYYGAADATPLFLILLEEYERWTGDRELANVARAGSARGHELDRPVRRSRRRRLRRVRAAQPETGSTTSAGRTPGTRSCSPTGRSRSRRARPASCRATSTTPSGGLARLAREVWDDPAWATSSSGGGATSSGGSTRTSGSPSATASRWRSTATSARSTRSPRTSATCCGAASPTRRRPSSCVAHLMSDALFSGWGIRTMAQRRGRLQPDRLPRRHGLAARQLVHRLGPAPLRLRRREPRRIASPCWRRRSSSTTGCPRRSAAPRGGHALPGRVPDGVQPAGLGHRRAAAAPPHAARPRVRRRPPDRRPGDSPSRSDGFELLDIPGGWGRRDAFGRSRIALTGEAPRAASEVRRRRRTARVCSLTVAGQLRRPGMSGRLLRGLSAGGPFTEPHRPLWLSGIDASGRSKPACSEVYAIRNLRLCRRFRNDLCRRAGSGRIAQATL